MAPKSPKKRSGKGGLTAQQARFVAELIKDPAHVGKHAAIKAGYAAGSAESQASHLSSIPKVAAAIKAGLAAQVQRLQLDGDELLLELRRIGLSDIGKAYDENGRLLPIHQIPEELRRAVSGVDVEELFEKDAGGRVQIGNITKLKLWDKVGSLKLLLTNLGLLVEKHDVTHHMSLEDLVAESEGVP